MDSPNNGGRPPEVERLPEPDLTYYLALRREYHAAQIQASTWAQALQTLTAAISARHNLSPRDGIDGQGVIHREPAPVEGLAIPPER